MSKPEFEFFDMVNDPERKKAAEQYHDDSSNPEVFYRKMEHRRKESTERQAVRYAVSAVVFAAAGGFVLQGGIPWLGILLFSIAGLLALVSSYGFGRTSEIGK